MEPSTLKEILQTIKNNIENNKYHDLKQLIDETSRLLYEQDNQAI